VSKWGQSTLTARKWLPITGSHLIFQASPSTSLPILQFQQQQKKLSLLQKKFIDYQWLLFATAIAFSFFDICQMELKMKYFVLC